MKAWKVLGLAFAMLFSASFAVPVHAISTVSVSPGSVPAGGTVTITVTQVVGPAPDVFTSLQVTDPLGNVFTHAGFSVSSSVQFSFPGGGWVRTNGPGGNTGTDVSGNYTVSGAYVDGDAAALGKFIVLKTNAGFSVPEFSQPVAIMAALMAPALLLLRRKSLA
ncbi:MAG TPA: hypothetical protein VLX56_05965 [Nitrososphaerales archaeon]|nr:hypothetical protein [Nitrososphaerales archaeon]